MRIRESELGDMKLFKKITVLDENPKFSRDIRYVAGICTPDNNFDAYTIVILDDVNKQFVNIQTIHNGKLQYVYGKTKDVLSQWNISVAWCEQHGFSSHYIEYLQMERLPVRSYKMSSRSKYLIVERLAMGIDKDLKTVYHAGLFRQLDNFYVSGDSNSGYRYFGDDNFIMACGLACHGSYGYGLRVDFA